MNVIVIILFVFFGLIIASFWIVNYSIERGHLTPPDNGGSGGGGGGGNLDDCTVFPFSELKECDPTDNAACIYCKGGFACVSVTDDNPHNYSPDGGATKLKIPNGNWCLPAKFASANCDPYVSTPILTKKDADTFMWRCHCKYPYLFENVNVDSDCSSQIACGHSSDPAQSLGKLVCPTGSPEVCNAGDPWTTYSKWDPKYGVCECKDGYTYQDQSYGGVQIKTCVNNTCAPGSPTKGLKDSCDCPDKKQYPDKTWDSWVSCPQEVVPTVAVRCTDLGNPQCFPDPCNPNGYWDNDAQTCVCNAPFSPFQVQPQESPVGWQCRNLCDDNGPCDDRGTCFVPPQADIAQCKNCRQGWANGKLHECATPCLENGELCEDKSQCCGYIRDGSSLCTEGVGLKSGTCQPIKK